MCGNRTHRAQRDSRKSSKGRSLSRSRSQRSPFRSKGSTAEDGSEGHSSTTSSPQVWLLAYLLYFPLRSLYLRELHRFLGRDSAPLLTTRLPGTDLPANLESGSEHREAAKEFRRQTNAGDPSRRERGRDRTIRR